MSVKWNGNKVLRQADAAMERGLTILAAKVRDTAKESMLSGKTGKHYPKMPQRSSAPYEAPAAQHGGGLRGRIHYKQDGKLSRLVGVDIKTVKYALFLEHGTRRMAPRPWLRPALHEHTGRTGEELFHELMP